MWGMHSNTYLRPLLLATLIVAGTCGPVSADELGMAPSYLQQLKRQMQFRVINGELTVYSRHQRGRWQSRTSRAGHEEQLNVNTNEFLPDITYFRNKKPLGEFHFTTQKGNRFNIRRESAEITGQVPLEFTQDPDTGATLELTLKGKKQTLHGKTFWHLLLADPDLCRQHLLPLLTPLRDDWPLSNQLARTESLLFSAAVAQNDSRGNTWAQLIDKLGSDQFSVRQGADRALRAAGDAALPYLQSLDFDQLDAEQRFRVRGIIASIAGDGLEDLPETIVPRLASDPEIWYGMLSRDDPVKRRVAHQRLEALLERSLEFDPEGSEATRKAQLEKIRKELP